MDVHQNAKNTPHGRRLMVERLAEGWSVARVAAAAGVTPKTVRKWRARHGLEGEAGLADRSSPPHHSPTRLGEAAQAEILAHPPLHAQDQRQGGTVHPDHLARMGLPASLHQFGRAQRRHAALAPPLQPTPTSLSPWRQASGHANDQGQPPW